jgi:hypothetical protein
VRAMPDEPRVVIKVRDDGLNKVTAADTAFA